MGRRSTQKKYTAEFDTKDTDSVSSSTKYYSDVDSVRDQEVESYEERFLKECLDALYEKRPTTREKALTSIAKAFKNEVYYDFVEGWFATILHQCLNSIKRGYADEIVLAANVIGLLALTTGPGDNACEILKESFDPISKALKSQTQTSKISALLDCLAIITFVGGIAPDVENTLQLMCQVDNAKVAESPQKITAKVASAYAFLLSTMDASTRTGKKWHESMSYFSSVVEKDDRSVRIAAFEALALLFEIGSFEQWSIEINALSEASRDLLHSYGFRGKVLDQVRNLTAESGGKGSTYEDLINQRSTFRNILEFLEVCNPSEGILAEIVRFSTQLVCQDEFCPTLSIETWAELIQLNFINHFLGEGFANHMQENEFLQEFFGFCPSEADEQPLPCKKKDVTRKKASSAVRKPMTRKEKRMYKSPNSLTSKARTQLRNRQRIFTENEKQGTLCFESDV